MGDPVSLDVLGSHFTSTLPYPQQKLVVKPGQFAYAMTRGDDYLLLLPSFTYAAHLISVACT